MMDKRQRQAWKECDSSGCSYMPRCTHYWGNRCKNLGGKKIPRIRPKRRTVEPEAQTVATPSYRYFMVGGIA
jgi:hypothetical protein